jgi:hypothetical protein
VWQFRQLRVEMDASSWFSGERDPLDVTRAGSGADVSPHAARKSARSALRAWFDNRSIFILALLHCKTPWSGGTVNLGENLKFFFIKDQKCAKVRAYR